MKRLLDVLREDLHLTGTKEGCGEGECGSCSVRMNGELVNSCLVPVLQAEGAEIQTVEGLALEGKLHPLQEAFLHHGGAQCGICTPGMLMASAHLLANSPHPYEQDIAFTVDVLGEAVVSEAEADQYARRYLDLMGFLAPALTRWPHLCRSNESLRGHVPPLNVSVKLSALYSQIHPADPDTAIERIAARLRPILRRAGELGAFINLDMESYALKDLTLRLFKTIFAEPEFTSQPPCGLALQAYLKDSEADLAGVIAWAREHNRRLTVRLVKGAYWDYETVIAQQRQWPVPVFAHKPETDANFEKLSLLLLQNDELVDAAFGTHNARSIAHVLAQAERLGLDRRRFEFQMLYGMADPIKAAVLQLGCRAARALPHRRTAAGHGLPRAAAAGEHV